MYTSKFTRYTLPFFMFCFVFVCFVFETGFLCNLGYHGTNSVNQAGLELRNPPVFASQVLGLKACVKDTGHQLKSQEPALCPYLLGLHRAKELTSAPSTRQPLYSSRSAMLSLLSSSLSRSSALIQQHWCVERRLSKSSEFER